MALCVWYFWLLLRCISQRNHYEPRKRTERRTRRPSVWLYVSLWNKFPFSFLRVILSRSGSFVASLLWSVNSESANNSTIFVIFVRDGVFKTQELLKAFKSIGRLVQVLRVWRTSTPPPSNWAQLTNWNNRYSALKNWIDMQFVRTIRLTVKLCTNCPTASEIVFFFEYRTGQGVVLRCTEHCERKDVLCNGRKGSKMCKFVLCNQWAPLGSHTTSCTCRDAMWYVC